MVVSSPDGTGACYTKLICYLDCFSERRSVFPECEDLRLLPLAETFSEARRVTLDASDDQPARPYSPVAACEKDAVAFVAISTGMMVLPGEILQAVPKLLRGWGR